MDSKDQSETDSDRPDSRISQGSGGSAGFAEVSGRAEWNGADQGCEQQNPKIGQEEEAKEKAPRHEEGGCANQGGEEG